MKQVILFIIFSFLLFTGYAIQSENSVLFPDRKELNDSDSYELKIYPNPAKTGQITLEMNSGEISEIRLVNIAGKEVVRRKMNFGTPRYLLTLENVPNGIYFIRVKTAENRVVVKKLIVSSR